ncbi:MAG: Peptide deformylase [Candidatus Jorgensenbacteria bacterium GW2011_GWA1_48_11]|uniref:Peptide deformylase n=1 Tax=Candidatus Jorgensenbacteria bacterium GW2011_GWA1_48_11 TaxID=1618660 RepID=A0A0G1UBE3_9BACT|nr:MAG: Peptide deformylase [Candidatus Jorgensenbacteria bacterium GW2011_GWA1_48_11]KKW11933.1 MAG: Peptide deformylase [Candidatus Jorgensenbacteria bacterium GW2011_GWB1_49_9]
MAEILLNTNKKEEKILRGKLGPFRLEPQGKKELQTLIKSMRRAMKEANGIGLSANQIGVQKRIFVAQVPDDNGRPKFYAVLNPEILKVSKETVSLEEGCLSVPETYGPVERPARITIQGQNLQGKKIKIKAWGLLARVFQHEIDHLDGKLFIDRAKNLRTSAKLGRE